MPNFKKTVQQVRVLLDNIRRFKHFQRITEGEAIQYGWGWRVYSMDWSRNTYTSKIYKLQLMWVGLLNTRSIDFSICKEKDKNEC